MEKYNGENREKCETNEKNSRISIPTYSSSGNQKIKRITGTKLLVLKELYNEGKKTKKIARIAINLILDWKTVEYHLKSLAKMELTYKSENASQFGNWYVTDKGEKFVEGGEKTLVVSERAVGRTSKEWLHPRSHNFKIKFEVLERPSTKQWLESWGCNDKMKNNIFYSKKFGDIGMSYTGKSILFQLPSLYFNDGDEALHQANIIAKELALKLEHEVEGLKLGSKNITQQILSQHHAFVNEPFAKWMLKHGLTYRDETLDIDNSKDDPEIETTDKEKAHIHADNYIKQVKDMMTTDNLPKISEINSISNQNTININDLTNYTNELSNEIKKLTAIQINTNKQLETAITLQNNLIKLMMPKEKVENKEDWSNVGGYFH